MLAITAWWQRYAPCRVLSSLTIIHAFLLQQLVDINSICLDLLRASSFLPFSSFNDLPQQRIVSNIFLLYRNAANIYSSFTVSSASVICFVRFQVIFNTLLQIHVSPPICIFSTRELFEFLFLFSVCFTSLWRPHVARHKESNQNKFLTITTETTRLTAIYTGQPEWAGTRKNIHSLTPYLYGYYTIYVINFLHLLHGP